MCAVIAIANQKGGVSKTTTSLSLCDGLALPEWNKKVLLIDIDPQCNASSTLTDALDTNPDESIFPVFHDSLVISKMIHNTRNPNFFFIPSSINLIAIEGSLSGSKDGFLKLKNGIEKIKNEFDYIIFDCPPSLSILTINALVASDYLIIPMQASKFSLDGLNRLQQVITTVQNRYNATLNILGVLFTMFNSRTHLSKAIFGEVKETYPVFKTQIPSSVSIEEAQTMKKSIYEYAPKSKIALSYKKFSIEVKNAIEKQK